MLHLSVQQESQVSDTYQRLYAEYRASFVTYAQRPSERTRRTLNVAMYRLVQYVDQMEERYQITLPLDDTVGWTPSGKVPYTLGGIQKAKLDVPMALALRDRYAALEAAHRSRIVISDGCSDDPEAWVDAYELQEQAAWALSVFKVEAEYRYDLPVGWWDSPLVVS